MSGDRDSLGEALPAAEVGYQKSGTLGRDWARVAVQLSLPPETGLMEIFHAYNEVMENGTVHPPKIVENLPLPLGDLGPMNLVCTGKLCYRSFPPYGLQRHSRFELRIIPFSHLILPSLLESSPPAFLHPQGRLFYLNLLSSFRGPL